jgi:pimeloyl-ACP methyl ester carboxylesterase
MKPITLISAILSVSLFVSSAAMAAPWDAKETTGQQSTIKRCIKALLPARKKKSALAPEILPVRVVHNLYRWYFKPDTRKRGTSVPNFLNDYDLLLQRRMNDKMGIVKSFFSEKYDTQIFYTATGKPDIEGNIPVVDPTSRGLYFYFHGSGTNKAGGDNFAYKMNKLAAMGYTVMSIDLPYHSQGSRRANITNANVFYSQLRELINEYRIKGMPVYLSGHSYGPDVIAEFAKRYPNDIDGILMISPGSFNPTLEDWFMHYTSQMTALWGDMVPNLDGSAWAGLMATQHTWRLPPTPNSPDPTVVNPNLQVNIISGQYEEYLPGSLDERGLPTKTDRDYDICKALTALFSGADCKIEPGVGHYIFEHTDADGYDVILRELLKLNGQSMANAKALKDSAPSNNLSEPDDLARRYARDSFFHQFVDARVGGWPAVQKIVADRDEVSARRLANEYSKFVTTKRDQALAQNIKNTARWNPIFYMQNQAAIDALQENRPRANDDLLNKYFKMLETLSPEERDRNAITTADVFVIPEKTAPTPEEIERFKQIQQQRKNEGNKGNKPQQNDKAS